MNHDDEDQGGKRRKEIDALEPQRVTFSCQQQNYILLNTYIVYIAKVALVRSLFLKVTFSKLKLNTKVVQKIHHVIPVFFSSTF